MSQTETDGGPEKAPPAAGAGVDEGRLYQCEISQWDRLSNEYKSKAAKAATPATYPI